jgi:hypothetical protein
MDEWEFEEEWMWDPDDDEEFVHLWAQELADILFLSDNGYMPDSGQDYNLGYLEAEDWWPLCKQLDEMVDLEVVVRLVQTLDPLLGLDGVPTELLEAPLAFLETVLEGHLSPEPSGRRVSSRKLVKIARIVVNLLKEFPRPAQAAVRAWSDLHRRLADSYDFDGYEGDLSDLLFAPDLPPAMTGFSMMIAITLMRWPDRAEGLPLPPSFGESATYGQVLSQWLDLPDSPQVSGEGAGEAEALFAQGQLAHMLAQMGAVELMSSDQIEEADLALAYSRLSRSILWIHNQCRHCPEREGVTCKVAANWPEQPVPLLDVAGEIANTGRIGGCVKM